MQSARDRQPRPKAPTLASVITFPIVSLCGSTHSPLCRFMKYDIPTRYSGIVVKKLIDEKSR